MIVAAGWLDGLLERLGDLGPIALLAVAAGLAFAETAMFLVPGEVGLVLVGAGGMAYGRFLLWNVLASVAWVTTVVSLGWALGDEVADIVDRFSAYLSVAVVVGVVAWLWWRRRSRRR